MKKRILSIVLTVAMVVAFMPATAFAAQTSFHIDKPDVKSHMGKYLMYNPKVPHISGVKDQMDEYKQACRDLLHEEWNEVTGNKKSNYSDEVWTELNACYDQEIERINNATKMSDILEPTMGFMLSYIPGESVDLMTTLADYTINVYKSSEDLPKLTKEYNDNASKVINSLSRSDFNDYYLTVLDACVDKYNSDKQNVESLMDFINMKAAFESVLGDYMENDEDEDDNFWDDEDSDDSAYGEEEAVLPYYVSDFAPYELFMGICTKDELDNIKSEAKLYLDNYYLRQLPMGGCDDTSAIANLYSDAISKIKEASSLDQIGSTVSNTIEEMIVKTGVKYELSNDGYLENLIAEINAYLENINPSDYSEEKQAEISSLLEELENILTSANFKAELYQLFDNYKAAFEKIPNKTQELKEKKTYYVNNLKAFKGKAQYDQKKLSPVITAGIKAINSASSLDACKSAYTKYLAKAKATIKKYKVTTSKTGKGTVTSSKTVTYGSSVTIELTPAAGHKISKVVVDGKKVKLKNSYKFTKIKKSHTVKVTFK